MDNPVNRHSNAGSTAGAAARQPQSSASVRAAGIDALPRQQLIEAKIVSVELAAARLQVGRSRAEGVLLQLKLDINKTASTAAARGSAERPATLLTTISATDLASALKTPGQQPLPSPQANAAGGLSAGDRVLFDKLSRALLGTGTLSLQTNGQRLSLLGRFDTSLTAQTATAETVVKSLAKWMPLQGNSAASLKALDALASSLRSGVAAGPAQPLAGRLSAALDKISLLSLASLQKPGALKQHMADSGMLMEARMAAALKTASGVPQAPSEKGSLSARANGSLSVANTTSTARGADQLPASPSLGFMLKSLVNSLQSGVSKPGADSGPAHQSTPPGQIGLPKNDLKAAVLEALGLTLRLHSGNEQAAARDGSSPVPGLAMPVTPAELVRLIRSALLTAGTPDPAALSAASLQAGAAFMPTALMNSAAFKNDRHKQVDTGELLKHLSRLLASIHSNQLSSTMSTTTTAGDQAASQMLMLDLPFMHGQPEMVAVMLERFDQGGTSAENEDRAPGYRIVLDFNFDSSQRISELHTHIRYTDGTVSASFWTASPAEAAIVDSHLPSLRAALSDWGLQVGDLSLRVGKPPTRRQGVTRQLLDERI